MTGSSTATVLVCDDEADVREMFDEYLGKRGYTIIQAANTDEMRSRLADRQIDLILLDINMPGEDGLSALRTLRVEDKTPVIMLTAAGETMDRILGLEMGADDYLGKPVDLRELEARIKAVLRRPAGNDESVDEENARETVRFGDLSLDLEAARLFDAEGVEIPLTAMEFRLLKLFSENKSRVLNRDQILEQAHDRAWDPFDRSIDIRISRLRRKIETNPQKPRLIRTVRGIGYVYDPD
jgi:two-component system phosphate regulon response regulator OmpR